MKIKGNINYCATVVEIKNITPLDGCDFVVATSIMGNQVIVGKDIKIGDIGLFFPVETQLSKEYLKINNLYRKPEMNSDNTKKGYFEENGRIRCVKFRGHKSEGLYMSLDSVSPFSAPIHIILRLGDSFDELNNIEICRKYIPKNTRIQGEPGNKKSKTPKESKLIEGQFRFHDTTTQLYKNLHMIHPEDLISITYKIHGCSSITSKILCKKELKWYEKVLKKLGVNIVDTEYGNVYASRKVLKNPELHHNIQSYYKEDIWGIASKELEEFLTEGMTIYFEIAGFLPNGSSIQGEFDYGCEPTEHKNFIYRITYTNPKGKVFEFSMKQLQEWCKEKGLTAVPLLYYGTIENFFEKETHRKLIPELEENWQDAFLQAIKAKYNEKDCYLSKNKVPEEGCVVRIESNDLKAYKCKSTRFLEKETKDLDKGVIDIETEN